MRKKNKLWTSIALMVFIIAIMAGVGPVYAQVPTIRVLPAPADLLNVYDLGAEFDITINVEDVTNLGQWVLSLAWDPNVLNYAGTFEGPPGDMDRIVKGTFLSQAGDTAMFDDVESAGSITGLSEVLLPMPATGASGSGLLVTIGMKVVGYGSTVINVTESFLLDPALIEIAHTVVTTTFDNTGLIPPAYGPTADFTYAPAVVFENDVVDFDASLSTGGFDSNTLAPAPITSYIWDFDGDGTTDLTTADPNDPLAVFNYTTAGTFNVNLTVYAPNTVGPEYEYDTKITSITVFAVVESFIDTYTVKDWLGNTTLHRHRGNGPGVIGSAFMPGETVTFTTEVIFQALPVVDVNVAFQVNDPDGLLVASLSAQTNITGQASVSFKLPQAPLPKFGLYQVISTASVFEEVFTDTLEFHVGWIIQINSVTVTPDPVAIGEVATVTLDITNFDPYDAYPAVLTASLFDTIPQIVGSDSIALDIAAGGVGTSATYDIPVTIASYAWPGPATAKANAYTDWPQLGGTVYSPEVTDGFAIA